MKKILSHLFAARTMLTILSVMIVFHLLVIAGLIPFAVVWGGRLTDKESMILFELISISALSLMVLVIAIRIGIIRCQIHHSLLRIALWMMLALFLLNTAGNLVSLNRFERYFFSPVTLLLSFFCVVLLLPERREK